MTQYNHPGAALIQADTLATLMQDWLDNLHERVGAQEISADTAAGYDRGVTKFLNWLPDREPTPNAIRSWKAELLKADTRPASVNAWLAGCRSFFSWLAEQGQIPFDPTQAIRAATRKGTKTRPIREALTDSEARRVLDQPDQGNPEGIRDCAKLALMLYTAARGIELHRADLQTVNSKLVLYVQGKGHTEKDEMLVITGEAESAIRSWLTVRGKQAGALFVSMSNRSKGERLSRRALRDIVKGYFDSGTEH